MGYFRKGSPKSCHSALIKKIRYIDKDNDVVYIFDSQELEDAIFMEGNM